MKNRTDLEDWQVTLKKLRDGMTENTKKGGERRGTNKRQSKG
jgi:hypothetical protein